LRRRRSFSLRSSSKCSRNEYIDTHKSKFINTPVLVL
jgi:hypothetical protein